MLLARLGLRAGEVVALELGDLRWREGEIVVRGKGLDLAFGGLRGKAPRAGNRGCAIAHAKGARWKIDLKPYRSLDPGFRGEDHRLKVLRGQDGLKKLGLHQG